MKITREGSYEILIGEKYNYNTGLDELKEYISRDIKEAIQKGELPQMEFTIKKHTFSLGQELIITIRDIRANSIYSSEKLREQIEGIANEYNRIERDAMADFYNTSFYISVRFEVV